MLKAVRLVLLFLGLGAAVFLVWRYGPQIAQQLAQVGWKFIPYLGVSGLVYILDALGWRWSWVTGQPHLPFGRLFGVRMAGEAVNKVTPLASLGGEPVKAYLLGREGTRTADAIASVTIAKNSITMAQIVFIFAGVAIALGPGFPLKKDALWAFVFFPSIVLAAMLGVAILDLRVRRRRESGGGGERGSGGVEEPEPRTERQTPNAERPTPTHPHTHTPIHKKVSWLGRLIAVWSLVADFIWARPGPFALSLLWHFLGWAAGGLEMLAGAYALGIPLSLRDALVMEALMVSINMATFLIPANVGTQEGGFVLTGELVGLAGAQGLALGVLRRCRDAIWICFGLLYLSVTEGRILLKPRIEAT